MRRVRVTRERGAAPVEFVLVSALLTLLFLGVVQLGIALHVRNVLVASASEGARYGANADRTDADGAAKTRELITSALDASYAGDVTPSQTLVDGAPVLVITVRARLPLVGLWGPHGVVQVRGRALEEAG